MKYKKSKIKRYKQIWITESVYTYLREMKKENNKSMTELLDIITTNYKNL